MKYDSVIWDFDGVLVDSRKEAWRAGSEILCLLGIEIDIQSQLTFRSYFTQDGIFTEADRLILRAVHGLIMQSRTDQLIPLPSLKIVTKLKVDSEIVSSGLASVAEAVVGDAAKFFTNIRGREHGTKEELFKTISPTAICITDTIVDVERCHKQSLPVIAVGWGYDSISILKGSRPTYFVESFTQLEGLFRKLDLL
ncbi:MAG: hypothetical protein M0D57_10590 [Sphingobacteriales bacterium JAD_PAG50586_3]|nr:MAG: hypothetical protein M0D57_10590 [Sphingobacteriales bacterium JAD_PAG50586_3]